MPEDNAQIIWTRKAYQELQTWKRQIIASIDKKLTTSPNINWNEKEIRRAVTVGYDPTANEGAGEEDSSHYPNITSNTFWVKLGKPSYIGNAGNQTLQFQAYSPPEYRIVYSPSGYVPEGTEVWIQLIHGQYFIQTDSLLCPNIYNLRPGTYAGIVGETINAGLSGSVLISTCNTPLTIDAINHTTNCTFYPGDKVTVTIDNCCVAFFTGCANSTPPDPEVCCPFTAFVCINGRTQTVSTGGGPVFWSIGPFTNPPTDTGCELCYAAIVQIELTCTELGVVTANLRIDCYQCCSSPLGGVTFYGSYTRTLDWSDMCDDPPVSYEDVVTYGDSNECSFTVYAARNVNDISDCTNPEPQCCDKTLWLCVNGDSREMAVDGGDQTWDVTACCSGCTSATLRIKLQCENGVIRLTRTYTCDGLSLVETTTISQFCYSNDPLIIGVPTPNCFLQILITITETTCESCDPGVTVDCCAETVPSTLSLDITGGAFAGSYTMTWDGGLSEWVVDGAAPFTARLSCGAGPAWDLSFEMDNFGTSAETCDPFCLTIDVTGNSYGITAITIGNCAGGPGGAGGGI